MIGQKISHYRILERLGGGGMGEVFKAEDQRLERPVAVKFLPPELRRDPVAKERFVQEAKAASALDHQNICTIHDIGETEDGRLFLAMAFYEGETLRKRLDAGPLPIDEALGIAEQVAEGLAEAHERGIVHRDVKPANLMLPRDGVVKIVDFGLARLAGGPGLTRTGMSVGTPAYMSPEQARSETVDHRTDLWSLGIVLYEMLTGRRPFQGSSEGEILHSVLYADPDSLSTHRSGAAPTIQRLVDELLARDLGQRLSTAREALDRIRSAREETGELSEAPTRTRPAVAEPKPVRHGLAVRAVFVGVGVGTLLTVILGTIYLGSGGPPPAPLPVQPLTTFVGTEWTGSWSPDGSQIAFVHTDNGAADLSVMSLGGGERRLVAGGPHDDLTPRWSPDGTKIAFLSDRGQGLEVFWVPATGGPERRIATTDIPFLEQWSGIYALGAMPWSPDGRELVFSRRQATGEVALQRIDIATGEARQLTDPPKDSSDLYGAWSPDGQWIAFTRHGPDHVGLWRIPTEGGEPEPVLVDEHSNRGPSWSPGGRRLVFFSDRSGQYNLWEIPSGGGRPRQLTAGAGRDYLPVVSDGDRVLFTRWGHQTDLYWLDLTGSGDKHERLTFNTGENYAARLGPDGERIAYHSDRSGNYEIWLQDRTDGEERALTDDPARDIMPDWSPSGEELVFLSNRGGPFQVWAMNADGTSVRRLSDKRVPLTGDYAEMVTFGGPRWSPDGETIGFVAPGESGWTVWSLDPRGGEPRPSQLEHVLRFDWYLDSRRVVYLGAEEGTGRVGLFAADLDDGEEIRLLEIPCAEIDVRSDGRAVSFVKAQSHFGMNLYSLPLESPSASGLPRPAGEPVALTEGQGVWHVHGGSWAAEGEGLVYTRDLDHGDLFVIDRSSE